MPHGPIEVDAEHEEEMPTDSGTDTNSDGTDGEERIDDLENGVEWLRTEKGRSMVLLIDWFGVINELCLDKPMLVLNGHTMWLKKKLKGRKGGANAAYRCSAYKSGCKFTANVRDSTVVKTNGQHTDAVDANKVRIRGVYNRAKSKLATSSPNKSMRDVLAESKEGELDETLQELDDDNLRRVLYNSRLVMNNFPKGRTTPDLLKIPSSYRRLEDQQPFVIYDSGRRTSTRRIIIVSTPKLMNVLSQGTAIAFDGTFETCRRDGNKCLGSTATPMVVLCLWPLSTAPIGRRTPIKTFSKNSRHGFSSHLGRSGNRAPFILTSKRR